MKEYIEEIIEIILENVSCEHQEIEEFPRGPKHDDPTYSLEDEKAVIEKCIEAIPARLIERPEITEEFIEKKARELREKTYIAEPIHGYGLDLNIAREFLSSLLNELSAKINLLNRPEITEEFIEKKARKLHQELYGSLVKCDYKCNAMEKFRIQIRSMFEEES